MKRILIIALILVMIIGMHGSVSAARVGGFTTGGGSHVGSGSMSHAGESTAGDGLFVEVDSFGFWNSPGSFSDSESDTHVASDEYATVTASGSTKVTAKITGENAGVMADSDIFAGSCLDGGNPEGDIGVETYIHSWVDVWAGPDSAAKGTATASGTATARAVWNDAYDNVAGMISSVSTGRTSAEASVTGPVDASPASGGCADAGSFAEIASRVRVPFDGDVIGGTSVLENGGQAVDMQGHIVSDGWTSELAGQAKSSASGSTTARATAGSIGNPLLTAYGSAQGTAQGSGKMNGGEYYPYTGYDSEIWFGLPDKSVYQGPEISSATGIGAYSHVDGYTSEFSGSAGSSASGSATYQESVATESGWYSHDAFAYSTGATSASSKTAGYGENWAAASILASPWVYSVPEYGLVGSYFPIIPEVNLLIEVMPYEPTVTFADISQLAVSGGEGTGSAKSSASGSAYAAVDKMRVYEPYSGPDNLESSSTNFASGKVAGESSYAHYGMAYGDTFIGSYAAVGDPYQPLVDGASEDVQVEGTGLSLDLGFFMYGPPLPLADIGWQSYGSTMSELFTSSGAIGPESKASTSVAGSADASVSGEQFVASYNEFGSGYVPLQEGLEILHEFDSGTAASGTLSTKTKSYEPVETFRAECYEHSVAESSAVLAAGSAVGRSLGIMFCPSSQENGNLLNDFIATGHALATTSTVVGLDPTATTASGKAAGSTSATGTMTASYLPLSGSASVFNGDIYNAPAYGYDFSSTSSGAGTATADVSAEEGLATAMSMNLGGNVVGLSGAEDQFGDIYSADIMANIAGGFGDGVKSKATLTKAAARDEAELVAWYNEDFPLEMKDKGIDWTIHTLTSVTDPSSAEVKVEDGAYALALSGAGGGAYAHMTEGEEDDVGESLVVGGVAAGLVLPIADTASFVNGHAPVDLPIKATAQISKANLYTLAETSGEDYGAESEAYLRIADGYANMNLNKGKITFGSGGTGAGSPGCPPHEGMCVCHGCVAAGLVWYGGMEMDQGYYPP
jgi:hypothetical protein